MQIESLRGAVVVLVLSITVDCVTRPSAADEPAKQDVVKAEAALASDLCKAEIEKWVFSAGSDKKIPLTLDSTPVLRWSNPTAGRVYGNLYVLTEDGCPRAMICPYKFFTPDTRLDMECVSLATSEVVGVRENRTIWSTRKAGIEWKAIPGEHVIGKTNSERQRQLKQLAADFRAELIDTRVNETGEEQQLRLLTQPVYRYESPSQKILSGGMFAFVIGTDPELVLVLEATESNGISSWRYSIVRMNIDGLTVKFQEKEVWRAERLPSSSYRNPSNPYFVYRDQL